LKTYAGSLVQQILVTLTKGEANKGAKSLLQERKVEQGALVNIDPMEDGFMETIDDALGIHANQDHPQWSEVYPYC
jgi:hypothetical protein